MSELRQNVLFVTKEELYIHHDLEVVKVEQKGKTIYKIPLHHLEGIAIFGNSMISPSLMNKCLKNGIYISFLTQKGKFLGRVEGASSGNVLLRKEQFRKSEKEEEKLKISKAMIAGKIQNSRLNLLRSAREVENPEFETELRDVTKHLENNLGLLKEADSLSSVRGYEGDSAKKYFSVFDRCIILQKDVFEMSKRTKRPPRSRLNALLSFAYALVTNDCVSACQAVGLDPFIGFLHTERPGRPSLALDLVEEFRPFADRFVMTLINRRQIQKEDILERTGSVYHLNDEGRKKILSAYQIRKQDEITHHFLE